MGTFVIAAALAIVLEVRSAEPTVDELVAANQSAVESVRKVDMHIEVWRTAWRRQRLASPVHLTTIRWSKDLDVERQSYTYHLGPLTNENGEPTNIGDLIESGDQRRVLLNWNWLNPQPITPFKQGSLQAWIEPKSPELPSSFSNPAASFALFQIQANLDDTRQTLKQLVSYSPHVKVVAKADKSGGRLWQLNIEHPHNKTEGRLAGSRYEVVLDPKVNYLVRSVVAHIADTDPSPANTVPVRTERHVTEFRETDDGIYYPTKLVAALYEPHAPLDAPPASEQEYAAGDITINSDLPIDALDFHFPKDARVYELPAVNGSYPLHIWGDNNKPVRTYTGDYEEFRFPDINEVVLDGPAYFRRQMLIALNIIVVTILATWIFLRKRRQLQGVAP